MIKEHGDFIKAVLVFSIIFWGTYFIGMHLIPRMYYGPPEIDQGLAERLGRLAELDESKL